MRCEDYLNQYGYEGDEGWHFMPLADAEQVLKDIGYSTLYDGLCYSAEFNDYPYMDNSADDDFEHARKNFYISKKY